MRHIHHDDGMIFGALTSANFGVDAKAFRKDRISSSLLTPCGSFGGCSYNKKKVKKINFCVFSENTSLYKHTHQYAHTHYNFITNTADFVQVVLRIQYIQHVLTRAYRGEVNREVTRCDFKQVLHKEICQ